MRAFQELDLVNFSFGPPLCSFVSSVLLLIQILSVLRRFL